jgi:hypothetical protein
MALNFKLTMPRQSTAEQLAHQGMGEEGKRERGKERGKRKGKGEVGSGKRKEKGELKGGTGRERGKGIQITRMKKYTTVLKRAISYKGTVIIKTVCIKNSNNQGLHHPSFKFLVFAKKKFDYSQRPIARDEFRIRRKYTK